MSVNVLMFIKAQPFDLIIVIDSSYLEKKKENDSSCLTGVIHAVSREYFTLLNTVIRKLVCCTPLRYVYSEHQISRS